jgi:2'-5' RNA ligase
VADPNSLELVIVAIPSDDDHVWKVSSEKVPHITLLYLGAPDWDGNEMADVASYVQHAASTLRSFGMSVERRGVLGDKSADVLFFKKSWSFNDLEKFRSQLRANQAIDKAYLSADQYPQWTPHLTLGYPETPAHKDDRDYPISWVNFDKIAMWVGDSEGPTFQLNDDRGLDVAMSQELGAQAIEEILEHYGVKGMKWGKRKTRQTEPSHPDSQHVTNIHMRVKSQKTTRPLSNKELQDAITRMNLEQQYSRLSGGIDRTRVQKGRVLITKILADSGKQVVSQTVSGQLKGLADQAVKKTS